MPVRLAQSLKPCPAAARSSWLVRCGQSHCQVNEAANPSAVTIAALSDAELVELAQALHVRLTIPLSQLEAEAVHRGVELAAVVRLHLIHRLQGAGAS